MGKKKAVNVGPAFANIHRLSTRRKQNEDQATSTSCAAMGNEKPKLPDVQYLLKYHLHNIKQSYKSRNSRIVVFPPIWIIVEAACSANSPQCGNENGIHAHEFRAIRLSTH